MTAYRIKYDGGNLELGSETRIMGVLNVTPDSFSDGGLFFDEKNAVAQGTAMAEQGADIIDIGGESTRPFAEKVSEEEETRRVIPIVKALSGLPVPISIDTTRASVARRALDAGARIINDISALRFDPEMTDLAVSSGAPVVLMHMKGTPENMQVGPEYDDPVAEIKSFFRDVAGQAESKGIPRSSLIIDPGIGFGKTVAHNFMLIRRLREFTDLGFPILIGTSRKSFIRNLLKNENEKDMDCLAPEVKIGTQASVSAAVLNGAHIVRVHDVAETAATLKIIDAIKIGNIL